MLKEPPLNLHRQGQVDWNFSSKWGNGCAGIEGKKKAVQEILVSFGQLNTQNPFSPNFWWMPKKMKNNQKKEKKAHTGNVIQ